MPNIDQIDQDAEQLYEALSHLVRVYQFRDSVGAGAELNQLPRYH